KKEQEIQQEGRSVSLTRSRGGRRAGGHRGSLCRGEEACTENHKENCCQEGGAKETQEGRVISTTHIERDWRFTAIPFLLFPPRTENSANTPFPSNPLLFLWSI